MSGVVASDSDDTRSDYPVGIITEGKDRVSLDVVYSCFLALLCIS